MNVCDICLGAPDFSGRPVLGVMQNDDYLFGEKNGPASARQIDLCKECRELFRHRAWDKIAERAHDVLLLRLGVTNRVPSP